MKKYIGMLIAAGLCSSAWSTVIPTSEDTYIMTTPVGTYSTSNFGTGDLRVGIDVRGNTDPADDRFQQSYTKYNLSGLTGTVTAATAYIRTQFGSTNINLGVYEIADDSWTEGSMTWANKPATGSLLKTHGPVNNGEWVAVDVTALVNAAVAGGTDNFLSLMFNDLAGTSSTNQSAMNFFSKESTLDPDLISYLDVTTVASPPKVLSPVDDSWVLLNTNNPAQFGGFVPAGGELRVGSSDTQTRHYHSFLKFNLVAIAETVTNAVLYIKSGSTNNDLNLGLYEVADDTWTEGTLAWDNQPAFGALAVTHGNIPTTGWIAIDVTASVLDTINNGSNQLWSIMLKDIDGAMSPSTQMSFRSKEIPGNEPVLVINPAPAGSIVRWAGAGATDTWLDADNWLEDVEGGGPLVPGPGNSARIDEVGDYALVESNDTVAVKELIVGRFSATSYSTLEIVGKLTVGNYPGETIHLGGFDISGAEDSVGILKISGGAFVSEAYLLAGSKGGAQINMTAGTADFNAGMQFGVDGHGSAVSMDLSGGILTSDFINIATNLVSINVHGGMLKVTGDQVEALQGWETAGTLFANYAGTAGFLAITYDSESNVTTVSSTEQAGVSTIVDATVANGLMRIVVHVPTGSESGQYPKTTTNLAIVPWGSVAHSDDGVNTFMVTNFNYSTVDPSTGEKVIYVDASAVQGFFGIGLE